MPLREEEIREGLVGILDTFTCGVVGATLLALVLIPCAFVLLHTPRAETPETAPAHSPGNTVLSLQ